MRTTMDWIIILFVGIFFVLPPSSVISKQYNCSFVYELLFNRSQRLLSLEWTFIEYCNLKNSNCFILIWLTLPVSFFVCFTWLNNEKKKITCTFRNTRWNVLTRSSLVRNVSKSSTPYWNRYRFINSHWICFLFFLIIFSLFRLFCKWYVYRVNSLLNWDTRYIGIEIQFFI